MVHANNSVQRLIKILPDLLVASGLLLFSVGALNFYQVKHGHPPLSYDQILLDSSTLTERKLAIEQALKAGSSTYTFTTNFIPGIGRVTDPAAYEQQFLQNAQKNNPSLKNAPLVTNYPPSGQGK